MKKKILLADDSVFVRRLLADILTGEGYQIIGEVGNGADAVRGYLDWRPDLVLMGVVMPEVNGIQALAEIRAADVGTNVIMCSSVSLKEFVTEALQHGAREYIFKPFSAEMVLEAVRSCLSE